MLLRVARLIFFSSLLILDEVLLGLHVKLIYQKLRKSMAIQVHVSQALYV